MTRRQGEKRRASRGAFLLHAFYCMHRCNRPEAHTYLIDSRKSGMPGQLMIVRFDSVSAAPRAKRAQGRRAIRATVAAASFL
ncbi:hypothetical protein AB3X93_19180, partial [Paraburkholderia sp. BR14262]|uniref:hypothetical protein n=1 Tax=Paraburkholderia sp. BR14262 TaxID=3236999 RepID=UPI0034CD6C4B